MSPEIQHRIRTVCSVALKRPLNVTDVLAWAISETWDEAVRSVPLWAVQGMRHLRQEAIWERVERESRGGFSAADAEEYLETEAIGLEDRYRPPVGETSSTGEGAVALRMANLDLDEDAAAEPDKTTVKHRDRMSAIRKKLAAFTHATTTCASGSASSILQEEQERELAPEIEQERQVFRSLPRKPTCTSWTSALCNLSALAASKY